jgi:hypothetical protein
VDHFIKHAIRFLFGTEMNTPVEPKDCVVCSDILAKSIIDYCYFLTGKMFNNCFHQISDCLASTLDFALG